MPKKVSKQIKKVQGKAALSRVIEALEESGATDIEYIEVTWRPARKKIFSPRPPTFVIRYKPKVTPVHSCENKPRTGRGKPQTFYFQSRGLRIGQGVRV